MLNFLPAPVVGVIAVILMTINIIFWTVLLFIVTLIKLIFRTDSARKLLDPILTAIAENWITGNWLWQKLTQRTIWQTQGLGELDRDDWYLVISNHLSWVDIFALQGVLNRRIPMLKFFLKKELARIPLMGQAWWALDFPFMSRHSKSYLKKHPEQAGKDLEATRKSCERFRLIPTSVMNFVEGTRYTPEKARRQNSPYQHLLKPKAGGLAFAVEALGSQFDSLLDVTIVYPDGVPTFWQFLCGRVRKIIIHIDQVDIPAHFGQSDYSESNEHRVEFQKWLSDIWYKKDRRITELLASEFEKSGD